MRKKPTTRRLARSDRKLPAPAAAEPSAPATQPEPAAVPIVGVGASAGGLDAFMQLLAALPNDTGMAYVFVQHLDPRHESMLAELLAKKCQMPVTEIKQDTAAEPNRVYVTPGQSDVVVDGTTLRLVPRITTAGRHLPIDSFLRSLASTQGSQGIAVILSGTGSDGTQGAIAIKAEGGITLAQDPASAGYDGMPRSAIAAGCIDFVLTPDLIAHELVRLSRHPYVAMPRGEEEPAEPLPDLHRNKDGFGQILNLLQRTTRADFRAYKPATIRRRIARRMALAHVETLAQYARFLEAHADEVRALGQDCLITVSSFFRDPDVFAVLCQDVVPRLLRDRPAGKPLRVWVPGCATGEEVYSIVICLLENAAVAKSNHPIQVFGTDLSESALERARPGRYPPGIAHSVSPERLQRFFTEQDGGYQVSKSIRDLCVFARHDVTHDPPFGHMDLISCRNMLIYLEPRMQQRVMAVFHYALLDSGYLLLGASETASASPDLFAPVDRRHRVYSKQPTARPAVFGFGRARGDMPAVAAAGATKPAAREELPREADRILLARFAPAGVILDEKDEILEFRGDTEPYLEHAHGRASLNLLKMARKSLLLDLRQAIDEARTKGAPARRPGVALRHRGHVRRLDLEVVPLRGATGQERSLLVLFEAHSEPQPARAPRRSRANPAEATEIANLQREVAEATRHLQALTEQHDAADEELQASGEEILSANEELQSINEELETAKEELQASNEELVTLNSELQGRNLQLERALEYANGIVETVRNPLLILDSGLRVERANRTFYDYFRVTPEETIGRLVYELGNGQWNFPALRRTLDENLRKAGDLQDVEVEHEFPQVGRRTLLVNVRKLSRETGQENIVLAFEDRTEARKSEKERAALLGLEQQARQRAEQADRIKDEFVATLSHELRGPLSAMVGWMHVLRTPGIDDVTQERGRAAIERNVKAQARLIEDLLDYSRVIAGKLHLVPQMMDLVPVAGAAIEAVRSAAEAKGIRLELAPDAKAAIVRGDPDRLQQVVWNLLSNAIKFTPAGGRVVVWIGHADGSVQVRVSDTGKGIAPAFLPHVFERFRQQDGTSQRMQGGLGLGMAIVKELVELHGGTVHADSPGEGRGAVFTVALPLPKALAAVGPDPEAGEPGRPQPGGTRSDQTALAGVRLLLVEDEPDTREMLMAVFEQSGAVVSGAASATEALEVLQRTTPDLLVCDIGLPGENGYELMRKIRVRETETGGRIPALALTAYTGPVDREKALEAGFDLHVPKPVLPAELVARAALLAGTRGRP